jgi:hypothetical protein
VNLFSDDLVEREHAASKYRTFAKRTEIPDKYISYWQHATDNGAEWPAEMAEISSEQVWPQHAFGTANAGIVVFWHRPGLGTEQLPAGAHIGPRFPVLGGLPHPHVKHWPELHPSPSWHRLHKYLSQALGGLGLRDCLSQVTVACINPVPGKTGTVDATANHASAQPGGAMDIVTRLCRPRLVLLCGREVQSVGPVYCEKHPGTATLKVPHPLKWDGHGGEKMRGDEIARLVRAALNGQSTSKIARAQITHANVPARAVPMKPASKPEQRSKALTFINLLNRPVGRKLFHYGFTLLHADGRRLGFVGYKADGHYRVYVNTDHSDPLKRFQPQQANENERSWEFMASDQSALKYALDVLRSAFDSRTPSKS